jgi:hypothetical protein
MPLVVGFRSTAPIAKEPCDIAPTSTIELTLSLDHIFVVVMRKANNGADEQEEHSELGVHFITPTSHKSPLFVLLLLSSLAVIDEDQKHKDDDASLPVRFTPKRKHRT